MSLLNLRNKRLSKKQTTSIKTSQRVKQQANPSASKNIKYTSQFENGLMHIVDNEYSKMYQLSDIDYEISTQEEQENVGIGYAEALNALDIKSRYQLLVLNQRVKSHILKDVRLPYQGDGFDNFREEMNQKAEKDFEKDDKNFEVRKYAIFTTQSHTRDQANHDLNVIGKNFENRHEKNNVPLKLKTLDGIERLSVFAKLLRPNRYFITTYQDLAVTGLTSKEFIVPNHFKFPRSKDYFKVGELFSKVLYIRQYPKFLEDKLIKEVCNTGVECAISIHAKPYNMIDARKTIQTIQTLNKSEIQKQQKRNFKDGIGEDMISGEAAEIAASTKGYLDEFREEGQKLFSGIFAVYFTAESLEKLTEYTKLIKDAGNTWQVDFDEVEQYHEEALNTILPIGKPYLDVEMNYMRDMTTTNIASQIPYSNVELQSPTGQVYGKNQLTHSLITIDRVRDLITPSGIVVGSSGSGKGMTVKWEIIMNLLKYPGRRIVIVDPEGEYTPIAKRFGGQVLDISTGTSHHLNLLDLPDENLLDDEDRNVDLVKEKANLLSSLFESLLKSFSDSEAAIVDRITRQVYTDFEGQEKGPTLVDWFKLLKEQPEQTAKDLALKVEPYAVGSQDIFAHATNVDLNARFIVFNIKKLDPKLKQFAMKVILDQIWKQVVTYQNKLLTYLYFDELQLNFDTEENAQWFTQLWSRVRKYGAIPTGITQNVSTLLNNESGKKMISNSEFLILLRQKIVDINRLSEVIKLTPSLIKFVDEKVPQGTGLISAGGVIVPFENPIPIHTELFELMNTDAQSVV
ncbi:VirB4-like conjugal transfer ATPase, CD1110 family [Lactovum miscens]|uniref:VirB4-like conjugal transfer ATPase, CD1110 family n=1 Tax=Lactovum miscens TaxID=190387 RepID=UPI003CCD6720